MRGPADARTIMPNAGNQNSDGEFIVRERGTALPPPSSLYLSLFLSVSRGLSLSPRQPRNRESTEFRFGAARRPNRIELSSAAVVAAAAVATRFARQFQSRNFDTHTDAPPAIFPSPR